MSDSGDFRRGLGPLSDLSTPAILDIAKAAVERLSENKLRAIACIARADALWPGLVAWHSKIEREKLLGQPATEEMQ